MRQENQPAFRWMKHTDRKYKAEIKNKDNKAEILVLLQLTIHFGIIPKRTCKVIVIQFQVCLFFPIWNTLHNQNCTDFANKWCLYYLLFFDPHTHKVMQSGTQTTAGGVVDVFGFVSLDAGPSHTYLTIFVHVHYLRQFIHYSSVVLPLLP